MKQIQQKTKTIGFWTTTLSGLVILSLSLVTYLFIIKHVYGRYSIDEILPTKQNLKKAIQSQSQNIATLHSGYSERMLPDSSSWIADNVATWKRFIHNSGSKCTVIDDHDIEKGNHYKFKTIVLPAARAMSTIEIIQLKRFVENGGSIIATSSTGSFDEKGEWRGWKFFIEVFGLQFTSEIPASDVVRKLKIKGGLPVTTGIPSGYALQIATWDQPIACKVVESRTEQVSYWTRPARNSETSGFAMDEAAAIVFGSYGKGKFVWMGFDMDAVKGDQSDHIHFARLFDNLMGWLNHVPTVLVKDWPALYSSAAILTPFLTGDISNLPNLLNIVRSDSIPITFFIDPITASKYEAETRRLPQYGDVGTITDFGSLTSEPSQPILIYDYESQVVNLNRAKEVIEGFTGMNIRGAMPFYGGFDENSIHALISIGYEYVVADSSANRTIPQVHIKGKAPVVSFHRTARDDYEIIQQYGLTDSTFQLATYIDDVNTTDFLGGLYMLRIHPEYQCRPEYISVVRELVKYIRSKNIWLTTPEAVRDWWVSKNALEVHQEIRSNRRIVLEISNAGRADIRDCSIQVEFNKMVERVVVSSDIIGTVIPNHIFDTAQEKLTINLPKLKASESLSLFIDFDNVIN
ncbi:MAG: hypothetical protein ACOY90_21095 [Candidatus Zhuqueibacterota bacterium]